jgi:AraC-like DNA-binding protein
VETSLGVPTSELARPLRAANPDAAAAIATALARAPAPALPATAARLAAAVEETIARGGRPDREALARALGMSGKTLARRLALEQRGFRDVVDGVRRALAHRLLVEEALDVGEVAQRVGFADPAALGKAFRRWFGQSPSSFRSRRSPGTRRATAARRP